MRLRESTHYILERARAGVDTVPQADVDRLITLIRGARNVVIFGRGRSGFAGRALAMRLAHLGIRSYVVGETITPPVHEDDLVVLISGSGETFSVVVTGQIARRLGCQVVTLTRDPESTLGKLADHTITLHTPQDEKQRELAPLGTLFEATANLFFDGVVAELMDRLKETEESMRARHATLE